MYYDCVQKYSDIIRAGESRHGGGRGRRSGDAAINAERYHAILEEEKERR